MTTGQGAQDSHHVTVKLFASVKDVFREREIQVPLQVAPDIQHLLRFICTSPDRTHAILEDEGTVRNDIVVLLNGRNIAFVGGLKAGLKEGDDVRVFPPTYGG